jgi:hypothetical protein
MPLTDILHGTAINSGGSAPTGRFTSPSVQQAIPCYNDQDQGENLERKSKPEASVEGGTPGRRKSRSHDQLEVVDVALAGERDGGDFL